jgi:hypothetical protein
MKPRSSVDRRAGLVRVGPSGPDEPAFRGAAYEMTRFAYVALNRRGQRLSAVLWPKKKGGLDGLAAEFERLYAEQSRWWASARAGRAAWVEALRLALAGGESRAAGPGEARAELSAAQKEEISRLLAEAESAPRDPLSIAASWDSLAKRKPAAGKKA